MGLLQQIGAGFPSATLTFFPQIEQLYVNSFMSDSFVLEIIDKPR
jgi:hypothetical protein